MDFKPSTKTIVTEIRNTVVDKVSRDLIQRSSQSAYLGTSPLTSTQVSVDNKNFHTVQVKHHLTINAPEPVVLSLTSTGPLVDVPAYDPSVPFRDAVISIAPLVIGQPLTITVEDDTPLTQVTVVIFNKDNGETESLLLRKKGDVFTGFLPTLLGGVPVSFDDMLCPSHGNRIRVMYTDTRNPSGVPKNVYAEIIATSPYHDARILMGDSVRVNKPVGIVVQDLDTTADVIAVACNVPARNVFKRVELLRAERPQGPVYIGTLDKDVLGLEIGDVVEILYVDSISATGEIDVPITHTMIASPDVPSTGELLAPEEVKVFGNTLISVIDPDVTGLSMHVIALNESTNAYLPVNCVETVYGSGEFVGLLPISETKQIGKLEVKSGDVIRLTYVDQKANDLESTLIVRKIKFSAPTKSDETPEEVPTTPFVSGTIELQVNGLFSITGSFVGTVTIKGKSVNATAVDLIVA